MFLRFWAISLALTAPLCAGEYVLLTTGARLRVESMEIQGTKAVLHAQSGSSEIDNALIASVEQDDPLPAPGARDRAPSAVPTAPPDPRELADAAAEKYGLSKSLVRSVMAAESGFRVQAISPKGAIGLMQLMPATASTLGADATDPRQNAEAGARYLRYLLEKYNSGLWHALAAYNAGPGAVEKYHGVPPYPETVSYIQRVMRNFKP